MSKEKLLEIKELFQNGQLELSEDFTVQEIEYYDGRSYYIEHKILNEFEGGEGCYIGFKPFEWYGKIKEDYAMNRISYEEFIKLLDSYGVNELADQWDYDSPVSVNIDGEVFPIE